MANKGSFTPGDPRAGRPKGSLNKTGREARELAQALVTDPAYLEKLKQRLIDGKLGDMEKVLWAYAYGQPPHRPVNIMDDFCDSLLPSPYDPDPETS
jgi:hypothetical protein